MNTSTSPHNYYPEKPFVPFKKTPVTKEELTEAVKDSPASAIVKRMVYVMLRNESANGSKINNHNPGGIQADSGRWDNLDPSAITGVFKKTENGTGKPRLFLAFVSLQDAVNFIAAKVEARQLFIGGTPPKIYRRPITNVDQLCDAYIEEWVRGSGKADPSPEELASFKSMYRQAEAIFR